MQRVNQDLAGCGQRIAKLGQAFQQHVDATAELWKDRQGRSFMQQHTSNVVPALNQLGSELTQSIELFEAIAKRLSDEERA